MNDEIIERFEMPVYYYYYYNIHTRSIT